MDKLRFLSGLGIIMLALTLAGCSNMPWNNEEQTPMWLNIERMFQHGTPSYSASVVYQQAKLAGFNMNDQGSQITVRPRQIIHAVVSYEYNCLQCKSYSINQIVVGIAGRSAQACIYQGDVRGTGTARFELKAPALSGEYDVRFKSVQASGCQEALSTWHADESPAREATIGKIIVQQKPKRDVQDAS